MKNVIIYTTPTCKFCKMAKEFFAKHNIAYTEHNVVDDEASREAMIQKSHQMGVPVIDIDGEIFVGFNQPDIETALGVS